MHEGRFIRCDRSAPRACAGQMRMRYLQVSAITFTDSTCIIGGRSTFGLAAAPAASAGAQLALRTKARSLTLAYGMGITTLAGGLLAFSH